MILLYPLVLVVAAVWVHRARSGDAPNGRRSGWRWFITWAVAGGLMTFSLLTGFSIGLFILPLAAWSTLWTARRAPYGWEWLGFVEGVGATLLVVALINRDGGLDPKPWLAAGVTLSLTAVAGYSALRLGERQTADEP